MLKLRHRNIDIQCKLRVSLPKKTGLLHCLVKDPVANLNEGRIIFQPGDKTVRRHDAVRFFFPTQQYFSSDDLSGGERDYGLVAQKEVFTSVHSIVVNVRVELYIPEVGALRNVLRKRELTAVVFQRLFHGINQTAAHKVIRVGMLIVQHDCTDVDFQWNPEVADFNLIFGDFPNLVEKFPCLVLVRII